MTQRLALILPIAGLLVVVGTLVVLACQPDPNAPPGRHVIIVPSATPKSLVVWWDYDLTYAETIPYQDGKRLAPFFPAAWYVGSESPANLIAERGKFGEHLHWGPMALDTEYTVAWRGLGEVHLRVPVDATDDQIADWRAEIEHCDPGVSIKLSH